MKFDKYEKFGAYHWWQYEHDAKYHRHADRVKKWVEEKNTLDIGAGDGKITDLLGIKGIDNEPEAVRLAVEKGADVILGDVYQLPYQDEEFDSVFMGDVLEHLEFPKKGLLEAKRVLKKYLYIVSPEKGTNKEKFHYQEWDPEELKKFVEEEGFVLEGEMLNATREKRIYGKFKKIKMEVELKPEKGIIYYTNNKVEEPIFSIVQNLLLKTGLPIVSCSLKPINFGKNIVLEGMESSYPTMVTQILTALENSTAKYVFFCENDVLYHPSHFDFIPERDDIYYYNNNNWRWDFPKDRLITYDELVSLSGLCVNRELAINHFRLRLKTIKENGLDKIPGREPLWARQMGYEPGTKKCNRGGLTDEDYEVRKSEYPNIDIRHRKTFSSSKTNQENFRRKPTNWKEATMAGIPGWDLKELFNL